MTTKTITYGCTTCGRTSERPDKWVIRGPEVVVQGIHLGTCGSCFGGHVASEECDGSCDGGYETQHGTYYVVEKRLDGLFGSRKWERAWSCRSRSCVESYDPDEGDDCDCPKCDGEHYQVRVVAVVDGRRHEEGP